jgi:hypothetical protein
MSEWVNKDIKMDITTVFHTLNTFIHGSMKDIKETQTEFTEWSHNVWNEKYTW